MCEILATSGAEDARRCCCTGIWTSSLRWRAGADDLGPWKPGWRATGSTVAAAPTTATRLAALGAIEAAAAGGAHPRCVLLMEGSEEPGSPDLPAYIDELADVIGTPQLIVCLDSSGGLRASPGSRRCAAWLAAT
ncbi:MAG: hypothetical protein R2697_15575 [Ilumatobacteraceae bacterium]